MGKSTSKSKRRRRGRPDGRKRGGLMMGMRSGFKGIADSVAGKEQDGDKNKWAGRIVTALLLAAAVGLLARRLL